MGIRWTFILVWAIFLVIITTVLVFFITLPNRMDKMQQCLHSNSVERVIDGDTFQLCSKEKVRLLCVDTPEKGEEGYQEAKEFLENLIEGKELTFKSSNYEGNTTDKYGRLLLWVYIQDDSGQSILINKLILEEGYGDLLIIPPEKCNEVSD